MQQQSVPGWKSRWISLRNRLLQIFYLTEIPMMMLRFVLDKYPGITSLTIMKFPHLQESMLRQLSQFSQLPKQALQLCQADECPHPRPREYAGWYGRRKHCSQCNTKWKLIPETGIWEVVVEKKKGYQTVKTEVKFEVKEEYVNDQEPIEQNLLPRTRNRVSVSSSQSSEPQRCTSATPRPSFHDEHPLQALQQILKCTPEDALMVYQHSQEVAAQRVGVPSDLLQSEIDEEMLPIPETDQCWSHTNFPETDEYQWEETEEEFL